MQKPKNYKLPFVENVLTSLKFLNLRSRIFPHVKPLWEEWKKIADTIKPEQKTKYAKRRRFRRRK
jgi:hypothetical protein